MLRFKIILGLILSLIVVSTSFYISHINNQATIKTLREENAKLDTAVKLQESTINTLQDRFNLQLTLSNELQTRLVKIEQDRVKLSNEIRSRNLEKVLKSKPSEAEKKINEEIKKAINQLEVDTSNTKP